MSGITSMPRHNRRPASAVRKGYRLRLSRRHNFSRNAVVLYSGMPQNEHTLVRNYKRVLPSNNKQ